MTFISGLHVINTSLLRHVPSNHDEGLSEWCGVRLMGNALLHYAWQTRTSDNPMKRLPCFYKVSIMVGERGGVLVLWFIWVGASTMMGDDKEEGSSNGESSLALSRLS